MTSPGAIRGTSRDLDHRAGQRGDREPGSPGAVNGLEEAGPVHHEAIEYGFSALRDRDLERRGTDRKRGVFELR